ncbi:class I SAM-dependent methyltransferase [Candidatus Uabimicrobium amorphum]|uniref:Methyltransferase n=1 Tax=Uabimicrobium amorphum TaxID=2596890 RepID=A0A5S9F2H1_UABAM|nr:class I SAM-dependent methyltransferase [Candidatus Uabimicrobium amorphum]BBM83462.1 hypothetical protein UABAM_01814 [Candidatus Uabimicrobium amorphum]
MANDKVIIRIYSPIRRKKIRFRGDRGFAQFLKQKVEPLFLQSPVASVLHQVVEDTSIRDGMIAEFGVFSGRSINMIAAHYTEHTVWGFDSFEGFERDWCPTSFAVKVDKKTFDRHNTLPQVHDNVRLIKGFFQQSLPPFLQQHHDTFSFLHIDCDTYEATKTIFELCKERIVPGTVIVFDEFFEYAHEAQAFYEYLQESGRSFSWLCYGGDTGLLFDKEATKLMERNFSLPLLIGWRLMHAFLPFFYKHKYVSSAAAVVIE